MQEIDFSTQEKIDKFIKEHQKDIADPDFQLWVASTGKIYFIPKKITGKDKKDFADLVFIECKMKEEKDNNNKGELKTTINKHRFGNIVEFTKKELANFKKNAPIHRNLIAALKALAEGFEIDSTVPEDPITWKKIKIPYITIFGDLHGPYIKNWLVEGKKLNDPSTIKPLKSNQIFFDSAYFALLNLRKASKIKEKEEKLKILPMEDKERKSIVVYIKKKYQSLHAMAQDFKNIQVNEIPQSQEQETDKNKKIVLNRRFEENRRKLVNYRRLKVMSFATSLTSAFVFSLLIFLAVHSLLAIPFFVFTIVGIVLAFTGISGFLFQSCQPIMIDIMQTNERDIMDDLEKLEPQHFLEMEEAKEKIEGWFATEQHYLEIIKILKAEKALRPDDPELAKVELDVALGEWSPTKPQPSASNKQVGSSIDHDDPSQFSYGQSY